MPLLTDGAISTLEDLRGYESAVYDLASTENIDLTQKLVLSQQELEVELVARLFRDDPEDLELVVVTPALQLWHTFYTLALVYRDAYNSHLNDRYQGKWKEYERLAKWAYDNLLATGVGMIGTPIPKADPPTLSTAPGTVGAATYWIRIAWVGTNGEEGCPSDPNVLQAPAGSLPVAIPPEAPSGVYGWNVYAGTSLEVSQLQNTTPTATGASWIMPESGLVPGKAAGDGQSPTTYKRFERVFRRG